MGTLEGSSWLSEGLSEAYQSSFDKASRMLSTDLFLLYERDTDYAEYIDLTFGDIIAENDIMDYFGFQTREEAKAFLSSLEDNS